MKAGHKWARAKLSQSCLSATLWTTACQAPLSMGFSRQEYWSGLPCPPPGALPNPGIEPASAASPAVAGGFFTVSAAWEAQPWGRHGEVRGAPSGQVLVSSAESPPTAQLGTHPSTAQRPSPAPTDDPGPGRPEGKPGLQPEHWRAPSSRSVHEFPSHPTRSPPSADLPPL